ncbi:MAG: glutamine-hydrolyzing GMP synthase [Oscillospiraceae bacterium]|jgi:GMP synthase (glutamine-hydrolysing)|nr:glutamine-hydrolyzing GMP synthase [Oscillospiraceae bacterium]
MSRIVVLDFGGQYKELIARRVRGLSVYSEIHPGRISAAALADLRPDGVILTGGPNSVYAEGAQSFDRGLLTLGIPILGICYGMQLIAYYSGGTVQPAEKSEFGVFNCTYKGNTIQALMSHGDRVFSLPEGFEITGFTENCPVAAYENRAKKLYGVQFHPETAHTERGTEIIADFLFNVCGCKADYDLDDVIETQCAEIRRKVGSSNVLLGLSGGVDSSVCAALLAKAIPGQARCVFVDHGLMRLDEGDQIEAIFSKRELDFTRVNAGERFLSRLAGVTDPETKRKIIGEEFVRTFEAANHGEAASYLAQGTIYPDVIESGKSSTGGAATIKSHHNVGGIPDDIDFDGIVEPLAGLFKDEVRALGRKLGLPDYLVERQPFPGPGLAIRIIGEITKERLDILQKADYIYRSAVDALPFSERPSQYFAVLTDMRAVGVTGDDRSYGYVLALRAVYTDDFMTCRYAPLSHELLAEVSAKITNELREIGRVVYDITDKPPATIEWE